MEKQLNEYLSDMFLLTVKVKKYHWNIEDKNFFGLHKFFEEIYSDLDEAIDEVAERIRMIGKYPLSTLKDYITNATIEECTKDHDRKSMLKELLADHEKIISNLKKYVYNAEDPGTEDLFVQRLRVHEKYKWMIESHL